MSMVGGGEERVRGGVKREGNAVEEGVEKQGVVRGAGADPRGW